ncbi:MAG: hypothetical protein RLZZ176_3057, partial [Cyanobacteriota bacterium]
GSNAYKTRIFIYVFSHDWGSIAIVDTDLVIINTVII